MPRRDTLVLWGGIIFSLIFTAIIWWTGQWLTSIPHYDDFGPSWYYWRLMEPTFWTRATAWGFYALHQVAFWGLIYYAQKKSLKYTTGLHKLNVIALGMNAFFILLHLVQSQIWYDGLAQDVSIWSSQASVVILLVWVLLMENSRRGLFFGKKVRFSNRINRFARTYHGYLFAWAIIYTFWYHPMEGTSGHLIGFFYMFLLLLQGSLMFTRVHLNKWWNVTLEVLVLVHGTLVAIMTGNELWPMFAFGFAGIFVITQMHGLGLSFRSRLLILIVFIASALFVYSDRGWVQLNEIIRIPLIEYLAVFLLAGIIAGGLWIARRFRRDKENIDQKPTFSPM
ncbi:MAG: hypothetical protein JSV42_15960 [Chloroflexota bacterium]|nr:MAG: hypothetical protein JSV42_15960 [Chloroflexota bacterium]